MPSRLSQFHFWIFLVFFRSLMIHSAAADGHPEIHSSGAEKLKDHPTYSLFFPKPTEEMRPLNTDRPTRAPSPHTIDAGHFQAEVDWVNYTLAQTINPRLDSFYFINTTLKAGLLDDLELQITPPPFLFQSSSSTGASAYLFGLGDGYLRFKFNQLGNNEGDLAFAIMPFFKVPNRQSGLSNNAVEGGLILPASYQLSPEWAFGFFVEWDYKLNSANFGYHHEGQSSAFVTRSWSDCLSSFLELYGQEPFQTGSSLNLTAGFGSLYKVIPDLQFDIGLNIGLTSTAPIYNTYLGLSFKI